MYKTKKGFTLIELIAVLVIMAIIALIATPLVMNIIRKARISADKRSIDAYGRSIELAIAGYLLDNGKFPATVEELTIEYSGNQVVCSTTQLNSDSSVYLSGCTVSGRTVDYAYGIDKSPTYTAYTVGDHISYNGVTYYVIEDSDIKNDKVKLLKENELTYTEMTVLNLTDVIIEEDQDDSFGSVEFGDSNNYNSSTVKKVVDKWAEFAVEPDDAAVARLITETEVYNIGFEDYDCCGGCGGCIDSRIVLNWMYSNGLDSDYWVLCETDNERVAYLNLMGAYGLTTPSNKGTVRPVLEISKTADLTKLDS